MRNNTENTENAETKARGYVGAGREPSFVSSVPSVSSVFSACLLLNDAQLRPTAAGMEMNGQLAPAQIHEVYETRAQRRQLRVLRSDFGEPLFEPPCRQRGLARDDDHGRIMARASHYAIQ